MRGRRRAGLVTVLAVVVACVAALVGAGIGDDRLVRLVRSQPSAARDDVPTATGEPRVVVTAPAPPAADAGAPAPAAALTAVPPPPPSPPPARAPADPPRREPCDVGGAAGAQQVVVVRGDGQRASVRACSRAADGRYVTDLGPFTGWVGRSGVAPAGAKHEGDGRTPSGVFPLRGGFGVRADPGLRQGWFVVDGADVWVDDPASALYNTHQRAPADGRWDSAERLRNPPAYDYAQVIGYNESRTPGAGSAIFLHVATGGPTAGCVSLPVRELLEVLRWERDGAVMVIS